MRTTLKAKIAAGMVRLGGYALPERFALEVQNDDDSPNLSLQFRVREGRVECSSLTITAQENGREVQTQDVRAVRILDWLEHAVQLAAAPIESNGEGQVKITYSSDRLTDRGAIREAHKARRRLRVTPERLREVAALVRSTPDPMSAVMDTLDVGQRAAQLWIKRARDGVDPETGKPYLVEGGE